jgi:Fur family ferric uptake transcriptional regulator
MKVNNALLRANAEQQIRATGQRLTQPRIAVLTALLASDHASSHQDVATTLSTNHNIDRVTVYRVLDWLVEVGIAHRIAGDDRVWRFMLNHVDTSAKQANVHQHAHQHAHFTCNQCGQTFCLNDMPGPFNFQLPSGFQPTEVDLKFRGACSHCS